MAFASTVTRFATYALLSKSRRLYVELLKQRLLMILRAVLKEIPHVRDIGTVSGSSLHVSRTDRAAILSTALDMLAD